MLNPIRSTYSRTTNSQKPIDQFCTWISDRPTQKCDHVLPIRRMRKLTKTCTLNKGALYGFQCLIKYYIYCESVPSLHPRHPDSLMQKHSTLYKNINFGLLQPYFGDLSCMPALYVIHYKFQGRLPISLWVRGYSWEVSPFVKLVFPFRRLVRLVFLWSYTSAPGGMPWLHGCGRNTRSVTK